MPSGIPQVKYSLLRHPIRMLEARTARDPGLQKIGTVMKYLAPVLTSSAFAAIFVATPGVTSLSGLLVWALVGAAPSTLATWGIAQGFKSAKAERELAPFHRVAAQLLRTGKVTRDELERRGVDVSGIQDSVMIGKRSVFKKVLGMGGMAITVHVEDTRLDRNKALKVPLPALLSEPEALSRFVAEAKGLCELHNKRIVRFFNLEYMKRETYVELLDSTIDYAKKEGAERPDLDIDVSRLPEEIPYIDMEFIEGATLEHHLSTGAFPVADAVRLGIELLEALKYIQARNIIHRDLKPENVFIIQDPDNLHLNTVKIIDFGLIKNVGAIGDLSQTDGHLTQVGAVMGTPTWMSPEQIKGVANIDWRTDLYAMGLMIYNMLSWRLPFNG
ncbi:MAG: serine/threonine protein kinase, partial [Candidatus Margulisbacteria bacterium]|nr:serine/threonine protein kinase [Candidatus Margulisiibacteriota bacterium]